MTVTITWSQNIGYAIWYYDGIMLELITDRLSTGYMRKKLRESEMKTESEKSKKAIGENIPKKDSKAVQK